MNNGCFSQSIGFWLVVVSICRKLLDLQLQSQFMTARNNSRMHLPFFFCKSLSECEYTFGITITVLKISQNNDNRGRHLEFYSHTGIGNWFQFKFRFRFSFRFRLRFRNPDSDFSIRPGSNILIFVNGRQNKTFKLSSKLFHIGRLINLSVDFFCKTTSFPVLFFNPAEAK